MPAQPAARNRSLSLPVHRQHALKSGLLTPPQRPPAGPMGLESLRDQVLLGPMQDWLPLLPAAWADVLFLDPPYNLTKTFGQQVHRATSAQAYMEYLESWLPSLLRLCAPHATVYICADWRSSGAVQQVAEKHLLVHNRITWEREKGRGARRNWKNSSEDIWFCSLGPHYRFNPDAVRLKRRVVAPYTHNGQPKDWQEEAGGKYRLTAPSNLWTDLTVPFWSMPENTAHPTQKPEKLLAKLLLASSQPGQWVLDPFAGSGTTGAVARKLGRFSVQIEQEEAYALLALERLERARHNQRIQGYSQGVFWERNSEPAP